MATQTETAAEESMPMDSGEILQVLQTINESEISAAQLALQKSQNPQVVETAVTVVRDHRALNQRIDQMVQENNIELQDSALSEGLETQTAQIEDQLAELSGAEFDEEYLRRQIELHELALQTAREDLMPNATDPQVKEVVSQASDHLEEHLQVAEQSLEEFQDSAVGGGPEEMETDEAQPDDVDTYERY
jgi:putative membrane protein